MLGMCPVWGRAEACTGLWWVNRKVRENLGDPGIDGEDNIKIDLQEVGCGGYGLVRAGSG